MKPQFIVTATAVFALAACNAIAQDGEANRMKLSASDSAFVTKALAGGLAEVELGSLAQQRGTADAVKQFGKQMVDDHSKANDELKTLAAAKGIPAPTELDAKSVADKTKLAGLNGAEFDRAYMQDMVTDHQKDVAEFRRASERATDPDVKAFAAKILPTLEDHLKVAQAALAQVKQ